MKINPIFPVYLIYIGISCRYISIYIKNENNNDTGRHTIDAEFFKPWARVSDRTLVYNQLANTVETILLAYPVSTWRIGIR